MRRIQLYLDDVLWKALHDRARGSSTTISELVREAVRERYVPNLEKRKKAMLAIVGIREDRREFDDPEAYVRDLRRESRMDRLTRIER